MKINLEYQLTQDDYFEYSYNTAWAAPDKKKGRIYYYLKLLALFVLVVSAIHYFSQLPIRIFGVMLYTLFISVYLLGILPNWIKSNYRRHAKKISEDPKNAAFFMRTEIELDEKGIFSKDEIGNSFIAWNGIIKFAETKSHYFLFQNSILAIVIPKRVLKNKEELENLNNLLKQNIPLKSQLDF